VKKLREQSLASGWADRTAFEEIDAEVKRAVEEAAAFALDSPEPELTTALDHVFGN